MNKLISCLAIGFIVFMLGCGMPMRTEFLTLDYNHVPQIKNPDAVEVYYSNALPTKPYTVIGIVETIPNPEYWTGRGEPTLEDYIRDMKKGAAKMGADAIIGINPPMELSERSFGDKGEESSSSPGQYSALKGQAIVYKK